MGAAQVILDQLNLSNVIVGWYRLFPAVYPESAPFKPLTPLPSADDLSNVGKTS